MPPYIQYFTDISFLNRINIIEDPSQPTTEENKSDSLDLKEFQDLILSENNCEYYSIQDFKINEEKGSLNIFHNNFNGLETKHDLLQEFLTNLDHKFDIITITETSEKSNNKDFLTNVDIKNFKLFSTPTLSKKQQFM